jgi:two-component system, OmpR family, phosphate regulon sensor histidine kinase PhoR
LKQIDKYRKFVIFEMTMNRKEINVVMLLFTLSLAGFLTAQFFWVKGAFRVAEDSFRQINTSALRSVVKQSQDMIFHDYARRLGDRIHADKGFPPDSLFCHKVLFALMEQEFGHYRLHEEYEYGIIDHAVSQLVISSAPVGKSVQILQSPYQLSLQKATHTSRYSVAVWFRNERWLALKGQNMWLLLVSLLLFIGIITGYFLSVARLRSQKRMTQVQRDFINNITHEFKTPLATISIAAEMIILHRKNMPDSQVEKYAAIIFEENRRIQHQVDQVLAASLLEEEDYRFNMKPLDMNILLANSYETTRLMLRDSGGSIDISGTCDHPVTGDPIHLTNVVNNLIDNGIKYSSGPPKISIIIKTMDEGVEISFCDKGIGIPSDQTEKIFDRMYRVHSGDLYHSPGTGIGLYYVKKVVERHRGTIRVESTLGTGSCFRVFLPFNPLT